MNGFVGVIMEGCGIVVGNEGVMMEVFEIKLLLKFIIFIVLFNFCKFYWVLRVVRVFSYGYWCIWVNLYILNLLCGKEEYIVLLFFRFNLELFVLYIIF